MMSRLLLAFVLLVPGPAAYSADCLTVRVGSDQKGDPSWQLGLRPDEWAKAACGRLVLKEMRIDDPRPRVNLSATYVEFVNPRGLAERRYNEWARGHARRIEELKPVPGPEDILAMSIFAIESLYRSPRLLSAAAINYGVGAHPSIDRENLNLDVTRGTVVVPSELFRLDTVAAHCWRQFATDRRVMGSDDASPRGEMFRNRYPSPEDFAVQDRSRDWTITDTGAAIEFGSPFGYVHGPFVCHLGNDVLRAAARPGVSVPP